MSLQKRQSEDDNNIHQMGNFEHIETQNDKPKGKIGEIFDFLNLFTGGRGKKERSKVLDLVANSIQEKEDNVVLENKTKEKQNDWDSKLKTMFTDYEKLKAQNNLSEDQEIFIKIVEAIKNDDIVPYYQLISGVKSSEDKYEVLGRAKVKGQKEPISAYHLFNKAKEYGLNEYVNKTIYTKAIENLKENEGGLSINLEEVELNDDFYCLNLINLVREKGIDPSRITIEIVETVSKYSPKTIKRFRDEGFKIAMDDAPEGYNTFSRISELKPDIVKLDRDFTYSLIGKHPKQNKVPNSIIEMRKLKSFKFLSEAQKAGCEIVIEGVDEEIANQIFKFIGKTNLKNVKYQGFAFGKPDENKRDSQEKPKPNTSKSYERLGKGVKEGRMMR